MNANDGPNMLGAIQQVRRLMTEVSKMLLEGDALMGQSGWEPRVGSTALAGMAYSIYSPLSWIPFQIFRFYRHPDLPLAIPCISVLLEFLDVKGLMTEPHVSGLLIEFETEDTMPAGVQLYEVANWHLYVPNRKFDGTPITVEPRILWPEWSSAKRMTSFAVPLTSIRDRNALRDRVISPITKISRSTQAAK